VRDGRVVSASKQNGKWTAFRTTIRNLATPLSHKHALAFAYIGKKCEILTEAQFKDYKLSGESETTDLNHNKIPVKKWERQKQ
jgi:hypothetical protein